MLYQCIIRLSKVDDPRIPDSIPCKISWYIKNNLANTCKNGAQVEDRHSMDTMQIRQREAMTKTALQCCACLTPCAAAPCRGNIDEQKTWTSRHITGSYGLSWLWTPLDLNMVLALKNIHKAPSTYIWTCWIFEIQMWSFTIVSLVRGCRSALSRFPMQHDLFECNMARWGTIILLILFLFGNVWDFDNVSKLKWCSWSRAPQMVVSDGIAKWSDSLDVAGKVGLGQFQFR